MGRSGGRGMKRDLETFFGCDARASAEVTEG